MTHRPRLQPTAVPLIAGALLALLATLLAVGCTNTTPGGTSGTVEIRVNWPGANPPAGASAASAVSTRAIPDETETLRVTITGEGMPMIRVEITRDEILSGSTIRKIPVPVGTGRTILVEALDDQGAVVASGKTTLDVGPGVTVRARVVLVRTSGSEEPPEVLSRVLQVTDFDGDLVPVGRREGETSEEVPDLPSDAKSGTLTLDMFPALDDAGTRPMVATFSIHSQYELWVIRGYAEAIPGQELEFETGVSNEYISDPGGYTTSFSGSLLSWDLLIGPILGAISGPGHMKFDFGPKGPLLAEDVTGDIDVGAGPSHTLIGSLKGELVF